MKETKGTNRVLPFLSQSNGNINQTRIKVRLGRQARLVEPSIPIHRLEFLGNFFVVGEEIEKRGFEIVGVEGFTLPSCKVVWDEEVELGFRDEFFEVVEEVEPLGVLDD